MKVRCGHLAGEKNSFFYRSKSIHFHIVLLEKGLHKELPRFAILLSPAVGWLPHFSLMFWASLPKINLRLKTKNGFQDITF